MFKKTNIPNADSSSDIKIFNANDIFLAVLYEKKYNKKKHTMRPPSSGNAGSKLTANSAKLQYPRICGPNIAPCGSKYIAIVSKRFASGPDAAQNISFLYDKIAAFFTVAEIPNGSNCIESSSAPKNA